MSFAYSCACESTAHKSRLTVNFSVSFPKAISHKLRTWKGQKYSVYFAGGSIHIFLQGTKGQDDTMLLTCCDLKALACMKAVTYLPPYIYLSCQRGPESSDLPGECIDLPTQTHTHENSLFNESGSYVALDKLKPTFPPTPRIILMPCTVWNLL